ncbi:protein EDS1L-like [Quercus robur]|uniref:protein EDS1L-like n=1 Tax=Quercus robur TaxID=38942 RepID=UPI00216235ED|nr:protein EDS1L-like [Quercus robur]
MASLNLGENIEIDTELIKEAYSLAVEAHSKSSEKAYNVEESRRSSDPIIIISFSGCWSENGWYDGEPFGVTEINLPLLFPSLRSIGVNENALVNKAFLRRFVDKIWGNSGFDRKVQKAVKENKQILFTGHSSGGSIANLTTIWFLEKYLKPEYNYKISPSSPLCVTFGCPLIGNHIFSHALRRENWARYFIHFVMRYDIVPRILLAPISSIILEFHKVLEFLNAKSVNLAHASIDNFDASNFYIKIMKNASSVASHAACNLTGNTNLLLETVSNFIPLSPYKPFGTYVFCTGNGKLVILRNPDAVLQLLFYSSQLCREEECTDIAQRSLQQHFGYDNEMQDSFQMLNVVNLDLVPLEQLPLSSDSTSSDIATTNSVLNDLGLGTRARLCLCAAGELEKRKIGNKESIDLKKPDIEKAMKYLEEDYQLNCGYRDLGCYDAFKLQETSKDFDANLKRLELAGIWDEIIEMLKRYELPDAFEGLSDWVLLGTRYRRLFEPLDIANYYRHLKNEDMGAYMIRGGPKRYRFTQRWREHAERMPAESSGESCFWAKVEELRIKISSQGFEPIKEEVLLLEAQVQNWINLGELSRDVLLEKSTLKKWWEDLPREHKLTSCIKDLKFS